MTKHINKIIILIVSVFILSCSNKVTNPGNKELFLKEKEHMKVLQFDQLSE